MFVIKRKFAKSTKTILKEMESMYNGFSTITIGIDSNNNCKIIIEAFNKEYDVFALNITEIIEAFADCGKSFEFKQI